VFELSGDSSVGGDLAGGLVVSVDVLVACFPHQEKLFPDDGDDSSDPQCTSGVGVVNSKFLEVLILK
jgi:hypothetical protein